MNGPYRTGSQVKMPEAIDYMLLMQMYAKNKSIPLTDVQTLISKALSLFSTEPNLIYLEDPVCIVGDLHGQLGDLYKVLELGGSLDQMKFLFLGDYVDRGPQGVEILLILFALKIKFPNKIFLLRGNHETRNATSTYGFRDECARKYNHEIWLQLMSLFDKMPLAAVINGNFFAVHGGLSPELARAVDLNRVNREIEPPIHGLVTDLIWSDPSDLVSKQNWEYNEVRGCGYLFGPEETSSFLKTNNLSMIIRAHQCVDSGFECKTYDSNSPVVVTLFSAEDYCGAKNLGAIMQIQNNSLNIIQFDFGLKSRDMLFQDFGSIFEWTLPLIDHFLYEAVDGFFEFTNDAIENPKLDSISTLDKKSLYELGINPEMLSSLDVQMSKTEKNIQERKRSSRIGAAIAVDLIKNLGNTINVSKTHTSLITPGENPEDFFEEVLERKRSDFFKKASEELRVNEDALFRTLNTGQAKLA